MKGEDLGCFNPAPRNEPVDMHGYCKYFTYIGDEGMNELFYCGLKHMDRYIKRKDMRWGDDD